MANEIEEGLIAEIRPVFPQFKEELVRNVIEMVRQTLTNDESFTVASLLPRCIDYLLDMPQQETLHHIVKDPFIDTTTNNDTFVGMKKKDRALLKNFTNKNDPIIVPPRPTELDATKVYSRAKLTSMNNIFVNQQPLYDADDDEILPKHFFEEKPQASSSSSSSSSADSSINDSENLESSDSSRMNFDFRRRSPDTIGSSNSSETSAKSPEPEDNVFYNGERFDSPKGVTLKREKVMKNTNQNDAIVVEPVSSWSNQTLKAKPVPENSTQGSFFKDPFQEAYNQVLNVIPDVEEKFALKYLKQAAEIDHSMMANRLVEYLFENKSYPKKIAKEESTSSIGSKGEKKIKDVVDYFTTEKIFSDNLYSQQCLLLLQQHFNTISLKDIREALVSGIFRYARTYKFLVEWRKENQEGNNSRKRLSFLQKSRRVVKIPAVLHHELEKEIMFIENFEKKIAENKDLSYALSLNNQQYEEEGQLIECGCCFGEAVFEEMIQCIEGHLFCSECLRRYAQEAIYGSGKMQLFCMTDGCESSLPISQLRKALPNAMIEKYQERLQDESLKMVELPDLVRCPFCDYAAEMPGGDKVFKCMNESCLKETCRYCKELWHEHFGIPCNEVEKKEETNLRLSYEEKMSKAKIRTCSKCGCGFMKTDGCNKMTCRCGTTMCYICRKAKIGYDHFCAHPRDPGNGCKKCLKCSLWTDPAEDDERAVNELKKEATKEAARVQDLATSSKSEEKAKVGQKRPLNIGPPVEQHQPKKQKKQHHHHHNHHRGHPRYNHHHNHLYNDPY